MNESERQRGKKSETKRQKRLEKQQKSLARKTLAAKMNNNWGREREERDYVEVTAKCVVIKRIIKSQLSTALCKPGIEWAEAEKKQLKSVHMTVKYPVIYTPMCYTSFTSPFPLL